MKPVASDFYKSTAILTLSLALCSCSNTATHIASYYNTEDDVKITLELYQSHPYLAEYNRKVVFGSKEGILYSRELPADTGGYAGASLYRCGKGSYFLDGYVTSEPLAVLGAAENDGECLSPENYLGIFEASSSMSWRFCPASECPETNPEMQGG